MIRKYYNICLEIRKYGNYIKGGGDYMSNLKIGHYIKRERGRKDLKAIELAEKVGISNSYLSEIENDKQNPSLKMLHRIAVVLGVEVEDLLKTKKKGE